MRTTVRNSLVIALLLGPGLVGCGSRTTVDTPDGAQVKVDRDSATIRSGDGVLDTGKGLPAGFPEADVPVLDGRVIGGSQGDVGGPYAWSVILRAAGDPDSVYAEIKKELSAAGYSTGPGMDMDAVRTGQFKGSKYEVSVNAAASGGAVTVTYLVRLPE